MVKDQISLCMGCMSQLSDGNAVCPVCGYSDSGPIDSDYLTPGTKLGGRYITGKLLSSNPENARYIGFDTEEDMKVWIIEFMPRTLCSRNHVTQAIKQGKGKSLEYDSLKADFRLVHSLLLPMSGEGVVPQLEMFEENNTVYVIYKFLKSITFAEYLSKNGGAINWATAKKMFMPLLSCLSNLHSNGIIHRGICPDNILVDHNNKLWLFNFGTQELRTDRSTLEGELYEGYSAPEQYDLSSWQGSWTDIYSIAAVMYRSLTGTMPPDSLSRKIQDNIIRASELDKNVPMDISESISNAMVVSIEKRTQTVDDFSAALLESVMGNTAVFSAGKLPKTRRPLMRRLAGSRKLPFGIEAGSTAAYIFVTAMLTFFTLILVIAILFFAIFYPMLSNHDGSEAASESILEVKPDVLPSFVGIFIETIKSNPEFSKYDFKIEEAYDAKYPKDVVFEQFPESGTEVTGEKIEITLRISKGSEIITMPNLEGSPLALAIDTLSRMDIKFNKEEVYEPDYPEGFVVRTDRAAGSNVRRYKDTVTLYVNSSEADQQDSDSSAD